MGTLCLHDLPLCKRNSLTVIVQHIFYLNLGWMDAYDLVPAVHNFTLVPNKDVIAIGKKDGLGLSRFVCEPIKLQRNGWRRRRSHYDRCRWNDYRLFRFFN